MKIIAFSSGTLFSYFRLEAFTPLGMINEREMIAAIGQRYNFGSTPTLSSYEALKNGLIFELGFYATEWGEVTIPRLSIHNDGVMVRTRKTDYSEEFFDHLTNWLIKDYGCRKTTTRSHFVSEVIVQFEKPVENLVAKYDKVVNIILSNSKEHNGEEGSAAFNTLSIELSSKSPTDPRFIIERREGTSLEDKHYFCSAPFTTARHVQALEEIERLFS